MHFTLGSEQVDVTIEHLVVAGWTGRDAAMVQHHIDELAALGVAPPSSTPLFYQVSAALLTQASSIQVVGPATSGEAEPFLITHADKVWLGLASDHTDRDLETTSVAASKQACAKVCAARLWDFHDVERHIDQLHLRSWIKEDDFWIPYQDGTLAQILPLRQLAERIDGVEHAAMLCGTVPAIGGVRPAPDFRAELFDPVLNRKLSLEYSATCLEIIS